MSICERCGGDYKVETDRIIPGIEGGKYVGDNTRELCQGCHKYRHIRDSVISSLRYEKQHIRQKDRIEVLSKRLEILDKENKPEQIRERGYYSYFNEYKEFLPIKRKVIQVSKEQGVFHMTDKLEFKPTEKWIQGHEEHPKDCDSVCYCIYNDRLTEYGFCIGLQPDSKDSPDIISFCCSYYDPSTQKPATHKFLWHPQEASWIATILSLAVTESWGIMPQYRKLMRQLANDRGIGSHESRKSDNQP